MPIEISINLPILAVKKVRDRFFYVQPGRIMSSRTCRSALHQLLWELLLKFFGEACLFWVLGHWLLIFTMPLTFALKVKL